jgi:hypothetical protein
MGYWDGLSFYPLDFSLHREKGSKIVDIKNKLLTANKRLDAQRKEVKSTGDILKEAKHSQKEARMDLQLNLGLFFTPHFLVYI